MEGDDSKHLVVDAYTPLRESNAVEMASGLASPSRMDEDIPEDFKKIEEKNIPDDERGSKARGFEAKILPPDIFPGVKKCEKNLIYINNPSGATLPTKLATLGVQEFRIIPALRAKTLGRSVLGYDYNILPPTFLKKFWAFCFQCGPDEKELKDEKWHSENKKPYTRKTKCQKLCEGQGQGDLVLLPRVFSKGFSYVNVYLRIMLTIIVVISVFGMAWAYTSQDDSAFLECYYDVSTWTVRIPNATAHDNPYYFNPYTGDDYDPNITAYNWIPDDAAYDYCNDFTVPGASSGLGEAWAVGTILALITLAIISTYATSSVGTIPFLRAMGKPEVEEYMFSYSWSVQATDIRTLGKAMWQNDVGVWVDVVKLNSGDAIRPVVRTMMKRVYRVVIFLSTPYLGSPNCCVEVQEAIKNPDKITFCLLGELPPALDDYIAFLKKDAPGLQVCRGMHGLLPILENEITRGDEKAYAWWKSQQITISGAPERVLAKSPIPMFSLNIFKKRPKEAIYVGPIFIAGDCKDAGSSFTPPWLLIMALGGIAFNFIDIFSTFSKSKKNDTQKQPYVYIVLAAICLTILAPFFEVKKLIDTRYWMHPILKPLLASTSLKHRIRVIVKGKSTDPVCANLRHFFTLIGHGTDGRGLTGEDAATEKKVRQYELAEDGELTLMENHVTVLVLSSIEERDKYLDKDADKLAKILQNSVVAYSGSENPFGDGSKVGNFISGYLVLTMRDCAMALADCILSGVAVRTVKYLHHGHEELSS